MRKRERERVIVVRIDEIGKERKTRLISDMAPLRREKSRFRKREMSSISVMASVIIGSFLIIVSSDCTA